jgi:molybdate transport system substrate-binding protein
MESMMRLLLWSLILLASWVHADEPLTVAAGAGYKIPLLKLYEVFNNSTGIEVIPIFGNMRTVIAQSKQSGRVSLAVGDRATLATTDLFEEMVDLGQGRLVLAWAEAQPDSGYMALAHDSLKRIAMPDPKKAIYGLAAEQFLRNSGLKIRLEPRLLVFGTVPQVSSHLQARSVDAGFINLTNALMLSDRIGGYTELPIDSYEPIRIVVAVVKEQVSKPSVARFLEFLKSTTSRGMLKEAGL